MLTNVNTSVKICGVEFKNPVIGASGAFGFGSEFAPYMNVNNMGGIACKGLTLNERYGNEGTRLCETPSGMINSIGLQNPGVHYFKDNIMPKMKEFDTVIIANLGGASEEEYLEGIKVLNGTEVDFIELNISCPNVKHGGMALGIKAETAHDIVKKAKAVCKKPLIVKLSPNAENIVEMAKACEDAGADALSLVNTFKAMAIDIYKRKPVFDNIFAGLSGPAIKPIALRMVYEVCKAVNIPVIGIGGISSWKDAVEFIMAGAAAVQVGAANFVRPGICQEIIDGIEKFMEENNYTSLDDFRGII